MTPPSVLAVLRLLPSLAFALLVVCARADDLPERALVRLGPENPDGGELERIRLVALSPDGRTLATTGEPADSTRNRVVHVWNVRTGERTQALVARDAMITSMSFSPDGARLVTAAADHPAGTQVWDVRTGRELASVTGGNGGARVRDDGRLVVVDRFGTTDVVLVFDANTGREIRRFLVPPNEKFAITPDGRRLVSVRSDRSTVVHAIEVETGRSLGRFDGCEAEPRALAISPDGRTVAAVDGEDVLVWELLTAGVVHRLTGHGKSVFRLAFTDDGRRLVTTSADRTVRTWEIATGRQLHAFEGHESLVTALDLSADGERIATGAFDRTAIVWNGTETRHSFLDVDPPTPEEALDLWARLGSDDGAKAYEAMGRVRRTPTEVVATIKARVHGTLVPAENDRIRELVADLDHEDFRVRHRATIELRKLRGIAKPILLKTYETSLSAEVRNRIRRIVGNDRNVPRFTRTDRLRMHRIVHACEAVASHEAGAVADEARAVLREIVDAFPDDAVVAEAKRALERLTP